MMNNHNPECHIESYDHAIISLEEVSAILTALWAAIDNENTRMADEKLLTVLLASIKLISSAEQNVKSIFNTMSNMLEGKCK